MNPKPDPRDVCTTLEIITRIDEEGWGDADSSALSIQSDFMCIYSFVFEGNEEWHLEQMVSIPTKLTKSSSKPLSVYANSYSSGSNIV